MGERSTEASARLSNGALNSLSRSREIANLKTRQQLPAGAAEIRNAGTAQRIFVGLGILAIAQQDQYVAISKRTVNGFADRTEARAAGQGSPVPSVALLP